MFAIWSSRFPRLFLGSTRGRIWRYATARTGVIERGWRLYQYNYNLTIFEERYNILSFLNETVRNDVASVCVCCVCVCVLRFIYIRYVLVKIL
jgi:hypothetical protein